MVGIIDPYGTINKYGYMYFVIYFLIAMFLFGTGTVYQIEMYKKSDGAYNLKEYLEKRKTKFFEQQSSVFAKSIKEETDDNVTQCSEQTQQTEFKNKEIINTLL